MAERIEKGVSGAISAKTVTYDLHRQMEGATKVGTSSSNPVLSLVLINT